MAIGVFVDVLERNHTAAITRIAPSHTRWTRQIRGDDWPRRPAGL